MSKITENQLIELLKNDKDSEEITMFKLSYPDVSLENKRFVIDNWDLIRKHLPIRKMRLEDNHTVVHIELPEWLGSTTFLFDFWEYKETEVYVDCADMCMRYNTLKDFLQQT